MLTILPLPGQAQLLNWSYHDILSDEQASGASPKFVVDDLGNVHATYWDRRADVLMYGIREFNSGVWTFEQVAPGLVSYGFASALAVDGNGLVHIAFFDRNINNEAELRYATNASGNWIWEVPAGTEIFGPYGTDFVAPRLAQASIDIELTPDGRPLIAVYDGSTRANAFCPALPYPLYIQYDLHPIVLEKTLAGWQQYDLPDVPNKGTPGCLPEGDRFGEFSQIIPRAGGRYLLLTNSVHNHELLLFRSEAGQLNNWEYQVIDSTKRLQGGNIPLFETFEHPTYLLQRDTVLHLTATVSDQYGFGNNGIRNALVYYQLRPDSLGASTFRVRSTRTLGTSNLYRTYQSLAAKGPDTIFISYVNRITNVLQVQRTNNGGATWINDTLATVKTNTRLGSHVFGDSLFVWVYDEVKDGLIEMATHVNTGEVSSRYVTRTEQRGRLVASQVRRQGNEDELLIAFTEDFSEQLLFGRRTSGGWAYSAVTSLPGISSLALTYSDQGDGEILFSGGEPESVFFARQTGSSWAVTQVLGRGLRNLFIHEGTDSTYAAGYDPAAGELVWMSKPVNGSVWTSRVFDNSQAPTGQSPVIRERNGTLYLGYVNLANNLVRLATRQQGQGWTFEDVTQPFNYNPQNLDMRIDSTGQAVLAFKDASTDRIIFAERTNGIWGASPIPTDPGNLIGNPLHLLLDSKGRPWILYNFPDIQDELRLLRRDAAGVWQGVSVLNNQGQVANRFDFHLVGDDFYIIGKKNATRDEGLAYLFAEDGVRTLMAQPAPGIALTVVPNPAGDFSELTWEAGQPGDMEWQLYNLQGQMLHYGGAWTSQGIQRLELPVQELPAGSYLVALRQGGRVGHARLVIIR